MSFLFVVQITLQKNSFFKSFLKINIHDQLKIKKYGQILVIFGDYDEVHYQKGPTPNFKI